MFYFALVTYTAVLYLVAQLIIARYSLNKAGAVSKEMLADLDDDPFTFNDHTEAALKLDPNQN